MWRAAVGCGRIERFFRASWPRRRRGLPAAVGTAAGAAPGPAFLSQFAGTRRIFRAKSAASRRRGGFPSGLFPVSAISGGLPSGKWAALRRILRCSRRSSPARSRPGSSGAARSPRFPRRARRKALAAERSLKEGPIFSGKFPRYRRPGKRRPARSPEKSIGREIAAGSAAGAAAAAKSRGPGPKARSRRRFRGGNRPWSELACGPTWPIRSVRS